ncbi:HalOD1 output domain-containing protein [Halopiger thermotolerans]
MSDNTTPSDSPSFQHLGPESDDAPATFHATFDGRADSLVVAIVEAVATVTGDDPIDMPPLFDTVNPEALSELVAPSPPRDQYVEVTFEYQGCRVTVSSDGDMTVASDH